MNDRFNKWDRIVDGCNYDGRVKGQLQLLYCNPTIHVQEPINTYTITLITVN